MKKSILVPGVATLGAMLSGCVVTAEPYPVVVAPAAPPYYHVPGGEGGEGGEGHQGDQQSKRAKVIYPAPGWYYD